MAREATSERVARVARLEAALAQLGARLQHLEQRSSERSSALEERLGRLECSLTRVLYCSAPSPLPPPPPLPPAPQSRKVMDSTQCPPINSLWLSKEIPITRSIGQTFLAEELEKHIKSNGIHVAGGGARRSSAQLRRAAMRSEARELERFLGLTVAHGAHLPDASYRDADKGEGPALHAAAPRRHAHDAEVLLC